MTSLEKEMFIALKQAIPYLRNHCALTRDEVGSNMGDRVALDMAERAVRKAELYDWEENRGDVEEEHRWP